MAKNIIELLIKAKDEASKEIEKSEGKLGKLWNVLKSGPMIAGAAVAGVVASLGALTAKTAAWGDQLAKDSQRVGVSVESLSTLSFAAERSGSSLDALKTGFKGLARNAAEAADGNEAASAKFEKLGISVQDASGNLKDQETLLKEVADRFATMEDGTEKSAAALDIFGRAGLDLIPMLNEGSRGIEDLQQRARDLGIEFSTKSAKDAEAFDDAMLDVKEAMRGLTQTIGTVLLPIGVKLLNWIADGIVWIRKLGSAYVEITRKMDDVTGEVFASIIRAGAWLADKYLLYYETIAKGIEWVAGKLGYETDFMSSKIAALRETINSSATAASESMRKWGEKTEEAVQEKIRPALDDIGEGAERAAAKTEESMARIERAVRPALPVLEDLADSSGDVGDKWETLADRAKKLGWSVDDLRETGESYESVVRMLDAEENDNISTLERATKTTETYARVVRRTASDDLGLLSRSLRTLADDLGIADEGFGKLLDTIDRLLSISNNVKNLIEALSGLLGSGGSGSPSFAGPQKDGDGGGGGFGDFMRKALPFVPWLFPRGSNVPKDLPKIPDPVKEALKRAAGPIAKTIGYGIGYGAGAASVLAAPALLAYGIHHIGQGNRREIAEYEEEVARQADLAYRLHQEEIAMSRIPRHLRPEHAWSDVFREGQAQTVRPTAAYVAQHAPSPSPEINVSFQNIGPLLGNEADALRFARQLRDLTLRLERGEIA